MTENKYYWLKLKKDFFKRHDIKIVESMPNGKDYVLFYLKLLLESVDHNGNLRFNETIPYSDTMLATITNTNIDVVRSAMKLFVELKMIDLLEDKTIYMQEIQKMIGTETYWAEQKRLKRGEKTKKIGQCPENVQLMSNMSNQEIEIELEKDIDIDKEIELEKNAIATNRVPYNEIVRLYHSLCPSLPKIQKLSESRKRSIAARWKEVSGDMREFETLFQKTEESDFLSGRAKDWQASFDWLMKASNFMRVIEGNYDNRQNENPVIAGIRRFMAYDS